MKQTRIIWTGLLLAATMGLQGAIFYADNFERPDATGSWGDATTGGAWTTGNDGGTVSWDIASGVGVMDVTGTAPTSASAHLYLGTGFTLTDYSTASFAANIHFNRDGQEWSTFDSNKAVAWVLGGTDADFISAGDGYAVRLAGDNGATGNVVEFGRYTGGIQNFFGLITLTVNSRDTSPDAFPMPDDEFSVAVTFNSSTNVWEMFVDEGFGSIAATTTTSSGTATDSTYATIALTHAGFVSGRQGNTGNDYRFDNLSAGGVAVPEPSTYALLAGVGALGLVLLRRRCR